MFGLNAIRLMGIIYGFRKNNSGTIWSGRRYNNRILIFDASEPVGKARDYLAVSVMAAREGHQSYKGSTFIGTARKKLVTSYETQFGQGAEQAKIKTREYLETIEEAANKVYGPAEKGYFTAKIEERVAALGVSASC